MRSRSRRRGGAGFAGNRARSPRGRRRKRDRRDAVGLTQEKAAERAGLSRNHYQLLESGLSDRAKKTPANPTLSTLIDLAHALGCKVGDLVDGLAHR
ncbi:helix-turn-helix domain-containing protein [Sanguibacter gelidistatuariae]|uniref:helix-turn-helix domain-containing protein n=1 Tax=Sanguibacter gelidistatuariae TaxID=1814289 RepID=UPI000A68609D|nr:helix-turn-helix transcriptional regulator [Sanguibacter gelidistatuariae]